MSPLLLAVSVVLALGIGVGLSVYKAGLTVRGAVFTGLYFASVGFQALGAPSGEGWAKAFVRLLLLGAIPALVCHVLPAMVACSLTSFIRKRRRSSSGV